MGFRDQQMGFDDPQQLDRWVFVINRWVLMINSSKVYGFWFRAQTYEHSQKTYAVFACTIVYIVLSPTYSSVDEVMYVT